ncbi:aminotransferase class I/II-fold pyridoxal phosphate-dependent enzyme [Seonamhaeicola aphaedonensis]|uniref:dTDP-4-amino-4,6-dideoxygalactose transaminase n=1 Tax=Seonamhaeicola aphaedonensis TaxID=1461338 RepID=A0A3D9HHH4_9FLAO|nr:aminotransferase class I/II-fold pyridoxal phosphate-dependent enzyme [Seonamhaeicola aphaedonensis]RED48947.1 dTDP-4-amino-4,6-dideoxygalactose transaminase [Seonamhaeicola aphaedonensis]
MNFKIKLSPPHMSGKELKYIQEAIDTNWVAPVGDNINFFEQDLEHYLGQEVHVTALSSGTAAIHLALILAGVKKGDQVICQSLTFAASAFPILYQGATPIFVDSEKETWNIDPVLLEEAILDRIAKGKKPKAIIVVHIFGMPAKMDDILAISKKYNIPLIEDAAEALGAEYKGQKCGTFGDFGIISFNGNKIITTSGGGALITKTKAQKEKAIYLATQAKDKALFYQHSEVGYNYRMSNIAAGIGRGQMQALSSYMGKRRENHRFYQELFKPYRFIQVFSEPSLNFHSNHWLTCIQFLSNEKGKNGMDLLKVLKEHAIESKPIWKPLYLQPIFNEYPFYGGCVAASIFEKGICLPSGSNLTKKDKEIVKEVVKTYLDECHSE